MAADHDWAEALAVDILAGDDLERTISGRELRHLCRCYFEARGVSHDRIARARTVRRLRALDAPVPAADQPVPFVDAVGTDGCKVSPPRLTGPSWPLPTRGETSAEFLQMSGGEDA